MENKVYVKCKYSDLYAYPVPIPEYQKRNYRQYASEYKNVDKLIYGEFVDVSWDEDECELKLKRSRKSFSIKEFDYASDDEWFDEPYLERRHVARMIEYLVIDGITVIDKREDCT